MSTLPFPDTSRWQPLRAGLINLYRFDREEFRFAGGRLLLRGNNGTGKTRALALLLPFLLDGEIRPARVEPDGNPHRRFEWHLLLDRHADRTGYAWLEFGRLDGDVPRFCTIGCGMRAVEGQTGLKSRWFFTTSGRLGGDLDLVDGTATPLNREALGELLAGRGEVHEQAAAHRAAVDAALYGLGQARYAALVDLLIELRRPQLTRDLDEERLSKALSDALPGLESRIITEVADSYRTLDREAAELTGLESAGKAVAVFNAVHHRHLQAEAAALADGARTAHGRYDHGQDKQRQARKHLAQATTALAEVEQRLSTLISEREQLTGEDRALRGSEAMRNAEAIDRLRGEHRRASAEAARRHESWTRHTATLAGRQHEANEAQAAHLQATTIFHHETAALVSACAVLGIAHVESEPGQQRSRLQDALTARRQAAGHLRLLERERQQAVQAATQAQQAAQAVEARRDSIQAQAESAAEVRARVASSHGEAVRRHLAGLVELAVVAPGFSLDDWLEDPEESDPLATALQAAARDRHGVLAGELAAARAQAQDLARQRQLLNDEAIRLEQGADLPPPAPPWRDEAARLGRPGAPFWRLVDFRPEIDAEARRGFEAALQAGGLLDAWVNPDGSLTSGADGDAYVGNPEPLPGPNLAGVLLPAVDPGDPAAAVVPRERVASLLAGIGSGPENGAIWVSADGRWRHGILHGAWQKPAAAHLGAGARAAARRERLAAIASALTALAAQTASVNELLTAIAAAGQRTDAEVATRPDPAPLRTSHRRALDLSRQLDEQRSQLAEAQAQVAERRALATRRSEALATAAETAGLTPWLHRLDELGEALHGGDTALLRWWSAHTLAEERGRVARGAGERAATALHDHAAAQTQALEGERQALGLGAELATQEATVGAAVGELLARLTTLATRQGEHVRTEQALRETRDQHHQAQARADQMRSDAEEALISLAEVRRAALTRLRQAASGGVLAGLGDQWRAPCPEDAADTVIVDLAALLAQATADAPRGEDARDRLRTQVNERFQDLHLALSAQDLLPVAEHRQGIISVRVPFAGRERGTADLGQELTAEITQRRLLLTARERELVENFLIDQAAEHLHELLFAAETWVAGVNRELAARPTSTGMLLRFRWSGADDGPAGLDAVRGILLRPLVAWSASDRSTLAEFLQQAIARERENDAGAAWGDRLASALDYRRWHRFAVERQQNGRWVRLTRRTHGTGSGGEKALALTLPMFAAAAAHYAAAPMAPRLILLDEAFVGIDQDMRRQCMGLLATFDLDVVMTSEREWGCYDTVPALAICQLAADPGGSCVTLTRYVWNGRERRRDDG